MAYTGGDEIDHLQKEAEQVRLRYLNSALKEDQEILRARYERIAQQIDLLKSGKVPPEQSGLGMSQPRRSVYSPELLALLRRERELRTTGETFFFRAGLSVVAVAVVATTFLGIAGVAAFAESAAAAVSLLMAAGVALSCAFSTYAVTSIIGLRSGLRAVAVELMRRASPNPH